MPRCLAALPLFVWRDDWATPSTSCFTRETHSTRGLFQAQLPSCKRQLVNCTSGDHLPCPAIATPPVPAPAPAHSRTPNASHITSSGC